MYYVYDICTDPPLPGVRHGYFDKTRLRNRWLCWHIYMQIQNVISRRRNQNVFYYKKNRKEKNKKKWKDIQSVCHSTCGLAMGRRNHLPPLLLPVFTHHTHSDHNVVFYKLPHARFIVNIVHNIHSWANVMLTLAFLDFSTL